MSSYNGGVSSPDPSGASAGGYGSSGINSRSSPRSSPEDKSQPQPQPQPHPRHRQKPPPPPPRAARRVVDALRLATEEGRATCSFEFFPTKSAVGAANLLHRVRQMGALLRPLFITLTWRADFTAASCGPLWLRLAQRIQQGAGGIDVMLHLTCHLPRGELEEVLAAARAAGIRNILALRGDAPMAPIGKSSVGGGGGGGGGAGGDPTARRWMPPLGPGGGFRHASQLVALIRALHGDHFCIAVGAYPEVRPLARHG
jgi:methylenetetrahydrofolate reductase (NADPH)